MSFTLALLASLVAAGDDSESVPARFTIRGRWADPRALTYRVDTAEGPLDAAAFTAAIETAIDAWRDTGVVDLQPAEEDAEPDVLFGWRRGEHEACPAFGLDTSVAHSGPVEPGTFVHFDAGRDWSGDEVGGSGESLVVAAAHEIGHVLGLGHSKDPDALMYADTSAREPQRPDLAGLYSLYGGGLRGRGDLDIRRLGDRGDEERLATLFRVAPNAFTDWRTFDTDGDADQEILVWRNDASGFGALTIYHFDAGPDGPVLARTVGPLLGAVPFGTVTTLEVGADTKRWIVSRSETPDEAPRVRGFDSMGRLRNPEPFEYERSEAEIVPSGRTPVSGGAAGRGDDRMLGDLDGDGVLESIARIGPQTRMPAQELR